MLGHGERLDSDEVVATHVGTGHRESKDLGAGDDRYGEVGSKHFEVEPD